MIDQNDDLLKESNVNFTLEIAGEWENSEDRAKVQEYIEQNNLSEKIKFLGLIHDQEKWDFYKKTDVKTNPINDADKRAKNLAEGRGIQLLNSKKNSGVFDFASSNEMWRASIEILDFTPLVSADPPCPEKIWTVSKPVLSA